MPLSHAWHDFADDYAKQAYQGQRGRQIMMVVDLWGRLAEGELIAYGNCTKPKVSDGPVLIPSYVFRDRPEYEVGDSDDLEIAGWRYENIRISECRRRTTAVVDGSDGAATQVQRKRGGGRPDVYEKAEPIIQALYENDANRTLSAAKLYSVFGEAFERRYPLDAYQTSVPSEKSLRTYLKRYRQKSEETGNN